jgi:hypothetical protein
MSCLASGKYEISLGIIIPEDQCALVDVEPGRLLQE